MPKSLKQEIVYGIMMVFAMVYPMVCYNVTLNVGGMQNFVFAAALHELPIMCPLAFLFDFFVVGPIAKKVTFRIFNPAEDKPIFVILMISVLSIGPCLSRFHCVNVFILTPLKSNKSSISLFLLNSI